MKTYYHARSNRYFCEFNQFTLEGIQYPANWLTLATPGDLALHKLEEVVTVGERADEALYVVTEELVGSERRITNTPKSQDAISAARQELMNSKLEKVRDVREQILNRLMGIASRAQRSGDATLAQACDSAAVALLDITKNLPEDIALVDSEVLKRYQNIVSQAAVSAPAIVAAFDSMNA